MIYSEFCNLRVFNVQRKISLLLVFSVLFVFPKFAFSQITQDVQCKQITVKYLNTFKEYKKEQSTTGDVLRFFEKQNDKNTRQIMAFWVNSLSIGNEEMLLDFKQRIKDVTWIENEVEVYINQKNIVKVAVPVTYTFRRNLQDEQLEVIQVVRVFEYNASNKIVSILNESFIEPKDFKKRPANQPIPYIEWKAKTYNDAITIGANKNKISFGNGDVSIGDRRIEDLQVYFNLTRASYPKQNPSTSPSWFPCEIKVPLSSELKVFYNEQRIIGGISVMNFKSDAEHFRLVYEPRTYSELNDSIVISSGGVECKIKLVGSPKHNDWYFGSSLIMSSPHLPRAFLYQDISRYSLTLTNRGGLGIFISNTQSQRSDLTTDNLNFAYSKSTLEYEAINQGKSFEYVSTDGNLERNYVGLSGSIKRKRKPSSFFLNGRIGAVITRGQIWDYYSGNLSLTKTDNGYYISDLTEVKTVDFQVGLGLNMTVIRKVFLLSVNADVTENGSISNSVGLAFRINNYKK